MSKMRVAQVTRPGGPFELIEREIPEPGAGHVRIKVDACGVCHSDVMTKDGLWPGFQYPRVPGHEIAGIVDAVGAGGVGWTQGHKASGSESAGKAVTAILVAAVTLLPFKLIGSGYLADGKGGRIKYKYNAVARGRFL